MHTEIKTDASNDEPPLLAPRSMTRPQRASCRRATGEAPAADWHDWRWQMRARIRTVEQLLERFPRLPHPDGVREALNRFQMAITPYYASLIEKLDASDPIFRMAVPQVQELINPAFLEADPLGEEQHSPVPGLIHRYPDRALLITTSVCAMYCRHCTRKRVTGECESQLDAAHIPAMVGYLQAHPEIHDVIVSGGDPLTLATPTLERILAAIRSVDTIEVIRIGTRTPVTLPMRITDELTEMLRKYHPVWINTHFNHPRELTREAVAACARLANAGIPLGNQCVLLRGVNDDVRVMEALCRGLVKARVRPYYLFQCDLVPGVEHFRTPISKGIEIMEYLRGRVSGLAIPTYVVDTPGGGGKIPVAPTYMVSQSPTHTVFRNFEGMLMSYPEPCLDVASDVVPSAPPAAQGVWELAAGHAQVIRPAPPQRNRKRARRATRMPVQARKF